ncbi:MAG: hypothetical protein Q9181_002392 [Wetmoreana brouardii]
MFLPANVFEEHAGHFWGYPETRPYMRARFALLEALLKINTYAAVKAAHWHAMEMLRLCRGDNMGIRDLVPAMYLRLGQDQACYDFCKWWVTKGDESDYDWGNLDLPYLNVKDADVLEPLPRSIFSPYGDLSLTVAVALLKIRLLSTVRALLNCPILANRSPRIPQEILDAIRSQLLGGTCLAGHTAVTSMSDQKAAMRKLEQQVHELYTTVEVKNKHFWRILVEPGKHLTARPGAYSHGSLEQAQLVLMYNYQAWAETPGAIDLFGLERGDAMPCRVDSAWCKQLRHTRLTRPRFQNLVIHYLRTILQLLHNMACNMSRSKDASFMRLPLEVRNLIYRHLLAISVTKTEKPYRDHCRSSVRYNWNIYPAILAINRQIHKEARDVFGSQNDFVVIECAARELEQKKSDMGKEDTRIMKYNVKLWPGRDRKAPQPWFCVVVREELRDVLVGISILTNSNGSYRTSGLSAVVTLTQATEDETENQRNAREATLLDPLLSLRFFKSLKVEGALEMNSKYVSKQVCRRQCDAYIIYSTFHDLLRAGDEACDIGYHDAATGYYRQAHDYALHFISNEKQVIVHPANPVAFLSKVNLQRARNLIETDDFADAYGAAETALSTTVMLFQTNEAVEEPPVDEHGVVNRGKLRE